jgi:hypothetical protein
MFVFPEKSGASRQTASSRSAAVWKAAQTKGVTGRKNAARKAARIRARNAS